MSKTFTDLYRKIYLDISYFNQDTKHDTCQNVEESQRISELAAAATIVELRCAELDSRHVVTADRRLFHCKITSSRLSPLDDSMWDNLQELAYKG